MRLSERGLRMLADFEGLRNQLYDDGGPGRGNCTIGVGHLIHYGPCDGRPEEAPYANVFSDDECYALLAQDVERFEAIIDAAITVPLNQNQYDALVDLAFNAGYAGNVFAAVNQGGDVCAELRKIVHDGVGNTLAGLVRRREAECALFMEEEVIDAPTKAEFGSLFSLCYANTKALAAFGGAFFDLAKHVYGDSDPRIDKLQAEVDALEAAAQSATKALEGK